MLTASNPSRAAFSAAILIRLARSAPLKPGVPLAMICNRQATLCEQAVTAGEASPVAYNPVQEHICGSAAGKQGPMIEHSVGGVG